MRSRLSLKTTANLSKHFFLSGYYGRGWGSKKNYYMGEFEITQKQYDASVSMESFAVTITFRS